MWDPWYLMILDKPKKVECKFYNAIISYCKDRMLFHLGNWHDGNGRKGVAMCSKIQAQVKALFTGYGGIVLWPPHDMFVPTPNGLIENMAIETSNLLVEGESTLTSEVEGAQIFAPLTNNT